MTARILPFPRRISSESASADPGAAALGMPVTPAVPPEPVPPPAAQGRYELTVAPLLRPRRALTTAEADLQDQMLQAFFEGHRLAKNHSPKAIRRDRRHVCELLTYVGQPLWALTEADFESWAAHLALERHLAAGSQRVAQSAVSGCFTYLTQNRAWQNKVQRDFGGHIEMIVTPENRLTHTTDKGRKREHKVLTSEQLTQVFCLFDDVIAECVSTLPRQVRLVQRDKAMFYTYYAYGLRLSEGWGLNLSSFSPNPDVPELGNFGFAGVYGKGSKGSGPKFRSVPAIDPDVDPVLTWYLTEVRPNFRQVTKDAQNAMWLSERGKRLCTGMIWERFKLFMNAVGLDMSYFTTHGLRHMSVSHGAEAGLPVSFIQGRVGHEYAATTQHYTSLADEYQRNVAKNAVLRQLGKWEGED